MDSEATLRTILNTSDLPTDSFTQPPPPLPGGKERGTGLYSPRGRRAQGQEDAASPKGYLEHEELHQQRKAQHTIWRPSENGVHEEGLLERERPVPPSLPNSLAPVSTPAPASAATPGPATPHAAAVVEGQRVGADEDAVRVQRELDVRAAFAGLPKVSPHWTHRYMKILVVGESGLGKTTFVRNLFAAYAKDPNFPVNDASSDEARQVFERTPDRYATEIMLQDAENKVWFHYLVQDTPGYGDSTDLAGDRQVVLDYIHRHNRAFLDQEQAPGRTQALHDLRDGRVDICLYFIPPHRLRKVDVEFMRELAALVPVVPILAKADTMTGEELREFRHKVRRVLGGAIWRFSQQAMEEAGARHGPPFAVIGSNTTDLSIGRFWPVRRYPWGSCEAMLTAHSDLPVLRRLLFETGYLELKDKTEERYHVYRQRCCEEGSDRPKSALRRALKLVVAALAAGGLWYLAVHGVPEDLKDEVRRKETVRRVKDKVNEKVEEVVGTVQDAAATVKERASNAGHVAKHTATAAVDRAASNLEGQSARKRREVVESRAAYRAKPWWKLWGE